jgi:signal transduction histidine kinase
LTLLLVVLQAQQNIRSRVRHKEIRERLEQALSVSREEREKMDLLIHTQDDRTRLKERADIAQKLHDTLGHSLTGSIMQLDAAKLLLDEDPSRVRNIIGQCTSTLREGLEAIRARLHALQPSSSSMGLVELRASLERFASQHGWQTGLSYEGELARVPEEAWRVISTNLNEALTNALRHSTGTVFKCSIKVMNKLIRVVFHDDGIVTDHPVAGMGLGGMKTRITALNGSLTIDTQAGFSISMLIPIQGGTCADTGSGGR